jgi:group I intron endonuclease
MVYKATNIINGKGYVGKTTKTLKKRFYGHKSCAKKPKCYFHRALYKYSIENFKIEVLWEGDNEDEMNKMERKMILFYETFGKKGYNIKLPSNEKTKIGVKIIVHTKKYGKVEYCYYDLENDLIMEIKDDYYYMETKDLYK